MTVPGTMTAPNSPVKLKDGLKFANGNDLTAPTSSSPYDRIKKINDLNGPSSLLANVESVTAQTTPPWCSGIPCLLT